MSQLWIRQGATVSYEGRNYLIVTVVDLNKIIATDVETGERVFINMGDVGPPQSIDEPEAAKRAELELLEASEEMLEIASARRALIAPLLVNHSLYANEVADKIAEKAGVNRATVYRWVSAFRQTGLLSSLMPKLKLRGGKAGTRLPADVEAVIKDALASFHDTMQKPTIEETVTEC